MGSHRVPFHVGTWDTKQPTLLSHTDASPVAAREPTMEGTVSGLGRHGAAARTQPPGGTWPTGNAGQAKRVGFRPFRIPQEESTPLCPPGDPGPAPLPPTTGTQAPDVGSSSLGQPWVTTGPVAWVVAPKMQSATCIWRRPHPRLPGFHVPTCAGGDCGGHSSR